MLFVLPEFAKLRTIFPVLALLILISAFSTACFGQSLGAFDRDNARTILGDIKDDIKKEYYDSTFRGIDIEKRFKEAELAVKAAETRDQLMAIVAQVLFEFDDSHLYFVPPPRSGSIGYGWQMQMIGNYGFITQVKPGSDAEAKGLKRGDVILSVDGFQPDRANIWKMKYRYYGLMPAASVNLVVQSPFESKTRTLNVLSKITAGKQVMDYEDLEVRYFRNEWDLETEREVGLGSDILIRELRSFEVRPDHIDEIMSRASKYKTLILDLRNNGGGSVATLERLASYLVSEDTKIAELKGRKSMKPMMAKSMGNRAFTGNLIVLIDSGSGSASEIFARFCQLEKKCTVVGDKSAGAVMQAQYHSHEAGVGRVLYFGDSVTNADVIMNDGKSLEKVGVTPDVQIIPSGREMATGQDPVLSRAVKIAGGELDPTKAGALFPFIWPKE